jgi:hypothetical protein
MGQALVDVFGQHRGEDRDSDDRERAGAEEQHGSDECGSEREGDLVHQLVSGLRRPDVR